MPKVLIIQEYIASYRGPFYGLLKTRLQSMGVPLRVAAGRPQGAQAHRRDDVRLGFQVPLRQREFAVLGRRLLVALPPRLAFSADVVVVEQARRNLLTYLLLLSRRVLGRPRIVMWGHGVDYVVQVGRLRATALRLLTEQADHFLVYTEGGAASLVRSGVPRSMITVVWNAIDTRTLQARISTARAAAGAPGEPTMSGLFIGGLDRSKRIGFLLEAAELIAERAPGFRLVIAGDGDMRRQVEAVAARCDWLEFRGPADDEQKAALLARADAVMMPGRVGLIAVDALAAGVPVLSTERSDHAPEAEYLDRGVTGFFSADDPKSYAASVLAVMGDPELLAACRERAAIVSVDLTVEHMSELFAEGVMAAVD